MLEPYYGSGIPLPTVISKAVLTATIATSPMATTSEKTFVDEAALHDKPNATETTRNPIVRLDDFAAADRTLAQQYGYQPVCPLPILLSLLHSSS